MSTPTTLSTCQLQLTDDAARLEKIHECWARGEKRLKIVIPFAFPDYEGVENQSSRGYRKARKEYRQLTGF